MEENEKKESNVNVPVIIVVIVLIIAICGGIVFMKNNSKDSTSSESGSVGGSATSEQTEAKSEEEQEATNASLIDMKNTENVEIVEGEKVNTSKDITKDREVKGLKLTEIQLKTEGGVSRFTAKVSNESGKDFKGGIVKILFKYGEGKDDIELQASIPEMKKDGTSAIDAGTTSDIANAKDLTLELLD